MEEAGRTVDHTIDRTATRMNTGIEGVGGGTPASGGRDEESFLVPRVPLRRANDLYHDLVSHTCGCRDLVDAVASGEESADLVAPLTLCPLAALGDLP